MQYSESPTWQKGYYWGSSAWHLDVLQAEWENDLNNVSKLGVTLVRSIHLLRQLMTRLSSLISINTPLCFLSTRWSLTDSSLPAWCLIQQMKWMLTFDVETISRRELPALLSPDEDAWEPLGRARRKLLLWVAIGPANSSWLTFRNVSLLAELFPRLKHLQHYLFARFVRNNVLLKWDLENDRPTPRGRRRYVLARNLGQPANLGQPINLEQPVNLGQPVRPQPPIAPLSFVARLSSWFRTPSTQ